MKNILLLLTFLLAAAPAMRAQDLKAEQSAFVKAFQDANNRGDIEALNNIYADEVTFLNGKDGSKTMKMNKAQLREADTKQFDEVNDQMAILIESIEALADGKVKTTGTFSGESTNKKTGEKKSYSAAYEIITVKENEQWKLLQIKTWHP